MLKLKQTLPAGAVLGQARDVMRDALAGHEVVWFAGQIDRFETDGDVITGWRSLTSDHYALPAKPNARNGRLAAVPGLQCTHETNCGFVVEGITENAAHFTVTVIYTPDPDHPARTLATVNTGFNRKDSENANYLFVSDGGDIVTAKDTRGAVKGLQPSTLETGKPIMMTVSLSGDQLAMAQNLAPPQVTDGVEPGMSDPASLFIGCRSHRGGLKKTLGGAVIHDVIFWPRNTLLIPRSAQDTALLTTLRRFYLWGF